MRGRNLVAAALLVIVVAGWGTEVAAEMRVRLLGTGGPEMSTHRDGIATLVEAGEVKLLVDVGRNALQNIYESGVHPNQVTRVFITHLHNDHYEGLPSLWMTPWFMFARKTNIELWGPPGTASMVDGMRRMFEHDLEHRPNDFLKREYLDIKVTEIASGTSYEIGEVKVTAFAVEHHEGNPAFGYRVERGQDVVLLSGDTTFHDNLITYGQNADVMVLNLVGFSPKVEAMKTWQPVIDKLMDPASAARILTSTRPGLGVFSHIVKKDLPGEAGDGELLGRVKAAGYTGPMVMGLDRMVVEIGQTITVHPAPSTADLPELDSPLVKF